MIEVIANADDFGKSHEVNLGILDGFKRGMLQRTTLMVNIPFADEAVQIAQENGFFDKVGLHLNLTEGASLTEGIRHISWLCHEGEMTSRIIPYLRKHWMLTRDEHASICEEMEAQFDKYLGYGLTLKHVDSHQHVHNELSICKMLCGVAQEYGFRSMRIARNLMEMDSWKQKIKREYKAMINRKIRTLFSSTDYFGSYDDYLHYFKGRGSVEVMLHPCLKGDLLYDIVDGCLVSMDDYKL